MTYTRQPAPHVLAHAKGVPAIISRFVGEREIAGVMAALDPFGIEDLCDKSPTAQHQAIGSCGDVVCCYCSRVFEGSQFFLESPHQ